MLANLWSKISGIPLNSRVVSSSSSSGQSVPRDQPPSETPGAQPGHPQQFGSSQGGRPTEPQAAPRPQPEPATTNPKPAGINIFANLPEGTANLSEAICIPVSPAKPSIAPTTSGNSEEKLAEKFPKARDTTSSDVQKLKSKALEGSDEREKFQRLRPFRRALRSGICEAFFGKTDGVSGEGTSSIPYKLQKMTLSEAREIWQTIANEMATNCFDAKGNVDVEKLKILKEFLGDAEFFKTEPFCFIPHTELMRSQMYVVCDHLISNKNGARDLLNSAAKISVGQYGQTILDTISQGRQPLLSPAEAMLASLFAPHRQSGMPTCTINSTINAEIRNHPERLIKMYTQMLSKDQFTFPSGYAVQQQKVDNGFITVDLKNGGKGRDKVFEDIRSGNFAKIVARKTQWQEEGIEYTGSSNREEKYKLRLSVHNMNDILYAHFLRASNFGNRNIKHNSYYGTTLVYAGHKNARALSLQIRVDGSNFLSGMAKLKQQAKAQQQLGHCYMRVGTKLSDGGHAENIDIPALLALDTDAMEPGKAYPICDRNWKGNMSQDAPRLAVIKVDGTPSTYGFVTIRNGSILKKDDISRFSIYTTKTKKRRTWRF
jgi:hypothetical protein